MTLAGTHHQTAAQRGGEAKDKDKPLSDMQRDRSQLFTHDACAGAHFDCALSCPTTSWHSFSCLCDMASISGTLHAMTAGLCAPGTSTRHTLRVKQSLVKPYT